MSTTTLLTVNLSTQTPDDGSGSWTPPASYAWGETISLALRFLANVAGQTVEPALDIRGTIASLGFIDARPASGQWALQVGPGPQTGANTTALLQWQANASTLAAAINAKSAIVTAYGTASVTFQDGSYLITFSTATSAVPLLVVNNTLAPVSIGRTSAYEVNGVWVHELRLTQTPVAFTDTASRILPTAPAVTRVRAGGAADSFDWNEIQQLTVLPNFRGTFVLHVGEAQTEQLTVADTPSTIQAALNAAVGAPNFSVTQGNDFAAVIEFIGTLAGAPQDLITVSVPSAPPGDLTFQLALDRAELLAVLRTTSSVALPLEVILLVADEDDVISEQAAFVRVITVRAPLYFPDLATVPMINWLRPPSPKDYIPFSETTVITGQQFARLVVGDGAALVFTETHGLATDDVYIFVRENLSNGRQLVDGTDFTCRLVDTNSVQVNVVGSTPPALHAWVVTVVSAQSVAAFAAGLTVTIGQVTGLQTQIDAIDAAVAALQALAPTTPLGSAAPSSNGLVAQINIPDLTDLLPRPAGTPVDLTAVPRPGGLLPAIHKASAASFTTLPLPSIATASGNVYVNATSAALLLPGGLGWRSSSVAVGGFFGGDGRRIFPLSHEGSSTSYFPRDLERELFMFEVNSAMMRAGATLLLTFEVDLQLLHATSRAQYVLVVEHGQCPSDTSPATTAPNLQAVSWDATPLLKQRLILGETLVPHQFGVQVIRAAGGALSANKIVYGFTQAADAVPASPDFAIRARLVDFDTEDAATTAVGTVYLKLTGATAKITVAS